MNDLYTEVCVKKKVTVQDTLIKLAVIAGVVLCIGAGLVYGNLLLGFLGTVGAVCAYLLLPRLKVMYEYVFCDGQLDFDKIMAGEKRKHMYRLDFENVAVMAPVNSHALDSYKSNGAGVLDFSSKEPDRKVYAIAEVRGETQKLIYFEPNEKLISYIKQKAPRKVTE